MPTQTGSIDFTSTGGFKSYATNKYATQSTVSQMQTDISQNAEAIALRATKTEASQMAQPNLSPFFSMSGSDVYNASTNPTGYWKTFSSNYITILDDGWAHVSASNTGSSYVFCNYFTAKDTVPESFKTSTKYTFLVETRNVTRSGSIAILATSHFANELHAFTASPAFNVTGAESRYLSVTSASDISSIACFTRGYVQVAAGASIEMDLRISIYEGEYSGPYKPYSGAQLYATQAELKVQSDRIGMVVANNDASSSLQLTSDAMTYIGGHVEIKGTDGTSTVISGGKIQANSIGANEINATSINASKSLTVGAMTDAAASTILNSNVQVGGRNLLHGTSTMTAGDGRWDTSRTFRASGGALSNVTTSGLPIRGVSGALRVTNTGSSAAQIGFAQDRVEGLLTGETYTQGAWVRASTTVNVFHQPIYKDASRHIKGAPVSIGTDWTYISHTGTLTGTQATDFYSAGYMYASAVPANGWFEVCGLKLEKGNKATDWTPAPEDITVEKYITSIDDNGIRVHAKSNATTNYAAINADGMNVVKGGVSVAQFGKASGTGPSARIGKEASTHVTISASETSGTGYTDSTSEMTLYDSTGESPDLRLYNTSRAWSDDSDGSEEVGIALGRDVYASKIRASIYEGEDPSSNLEILTGDLSTSVNAGTFIGSQRHWASDSSKFDKASVQTTSGAGGGASVQISAMSGNPNAAGAYAGMSVEATSSGTAVTIEAKEIKLYDNQEDSYSSVYITHGMFGQSTATPANSYQDFTVTFGHTYTSYPHVVVGFYSTSTAAALGSMSCAVHSITYTGCKVRVFNNTSSARSPGFEWIAIG